MNVKTVLHTLCLLLVVVSFIWIVIASLEPNLPHVIGSVSLFLISGLGTSLCE